MNDLNVHFNRHEHGCCFVVCTASCLPVDTRESSAGHLRVRPLFLVEILKVDALFALERLTDDQQLICVDNPG